MSSFVSPVSSVTLSGNAVRIPEIVRVDRAQASSCPVNADTVSRRSSKAVSQHTKSAAVRQNFFSSQKLQDTKFFGSKSSATLNPVQLSELQRPLLIAMSASAGDNPTSSAEASEADISEDEQILNGTGTNGVSGDDDGTLAVRRHAFIRMYKRNTYYALFHPEQVANNILEEIVWNKEVEVEKLRERVPLDQLQRRYREEPPPPARSFVEALRTAGQSGRVTPALIAEVKKASPSKGILREDFDPVAIAKSYKEAGASCLSVLTDSKYFQGSFEYLKAIRESVPDIPLLCKDFILYPYQIYLARMNGADAILLIAAVLTDADMQYLLKIGKALNVTCLIEVHSLAEMDRVLGLEGVELIGINNRNLKTFNVDIATTEGILAERIATIKERGIIVVSESGLHVPADLALVSAAGCGAVLIGESLVTKPDPGQAIRELFQTA